ncbi:MAG: RimK/LysX family protein, partial [Desulfobacterales bacterium]
EKAPSSNDLRVAGWVEYVSLFPGNLKVKAKLDTGARNSSLNANHIEEFERDGATWVRFKLKNWKGRSESFEARIARMAKIKQHDNESATRPVIRLGICLGDVYKKVEVNLEDRSKFNYQMLIGRSYLKDSFLVNASATFTMEPTCQGHIDR